MNEMYLSVLVVVQIQRRHYCVVVSSLSIAPVYRA